VLEEPALRRPLGGAATMRGQLRRLLEVQELPHADLHVLPFTADVVGGSFGQFIILEFEDEDDPPAVYLDGVAGADVLRSDTRFSEPYVRMYDRLYRAALDAPASTAFIRRLADELG
jgi:Domain of unknown function (DUF5753)